MTCIKKLLKIIYRRRKITFYRDNILKSPLPQLYLIQRECFEFQRISIINIAEIKVLQ